MFCDLASIVLQARYVGSGGSFVVLNVGICRSKIQENQEAGCISTIPAARGARDLQKLK
jgi:hypothetical protein